MLCLGYVQLPLPMLLIKYGFSSQKLKGLNDLLREMSAFVGARLFSFGFEMAWMYITAILIGINDTICKILAQFAIVVMNYVFSKLFIFKNKEKENGLSK